MARRDESDQDLEHTAATADADGAAPSAATETGPKQRRKLEESYEAISDLPDELREELEADVAALEELTLADAAGNVRDLRGTWRWTVFVAALILSLFHLYTAQFGVLPGLQQRSFHLGMGLALVFLLYPGGDVSDRKVAIRGWIMAALALGATGLAMASGEADMYLAVPVVVLVAAVMATRHLPVTVLGMPLGDVVLAGLSLAVGWFIFDNWLEIGQGAGLLTDENVLVATTGVLLVLLATQRVIGTPLTAVASLALLYAYFGQQMPGFLAHGGFSLRRIVASQFLGTEAIFGTPIRVSSTFIFIFMIFAALLQRTGMERFFTQLAFGLTGWMTGGTAKVGVLTSAFSGTITGSSVANTVSNGAFTIPMMKKSGYKGEFAGAVEAASSTGGQLAPPIMGAAAFIMIELTGLSYAYIIRAAAIPAILFFTAQFIVIHYESKRLGIMGLPRHKLPQPRQLMLRKGYLLLPIVVIFVLLAQGRSAIRSALYAVFAVVIINLVVQVIGAAFGRWKTLDDKLTPWTLLDGLVDAARIALPIIVACAAAGIVAGVITLTGVGLQLVSGLLSLAGEMLVLTMFFSMIACLVLGIGLPTTANYVITATLVAPALLFFDAVPVIAAHMFVYYFGIMADITPPVCLASYAASGIAQSNPLKTGVQSVKIAIGGFLLPYLFVLSPQLLLEEATILEGTLAAISALIGVSAVGIGVVGFMDRKLPWLIRGVLVASGLALLNADPFTDAIGLGTFAVVFVWQWRSGRRIRSDARTEASGATGAQAEQQLDAEQGADLDAGGER
ncbi:MAG: TRAP transporter permease [Nitriliruptoraceae bacterium]|nr:TRAP transporter permease [Nitriliruptoraceae bacterium]